MAGKKSCTGGAGSGVGRLEKAGHPMPAMHKQMSKGKSPKSVHNANTGMRLEHEGVLGEEQRRRMKLAQLGLGTTPLSKAEKAHVASRGDDVYAYEAVRRAREANKRNKAKL